MLQKCFMITFQISPDSVQGQGIDVKALLLSQIFSRRFLGGNYPRIVNFTAMQSYRKWICAYLDQNRDRRGVKQAVSFPIAREIGYREKFISVDNIFENRYVQKIGSIRFWVSNPQIIQSIFQTNLHLNVYPQIHAFLYFSLICVLFYLYKCA